MDEVHLWNNFSTISQTREEGHGISRILQVYYPFDPYLRNIVDIKEYICNHC